MYISDFKKGADRRTVSWMCWGLWWWQTVCVYLVMMGCVCLRYLVMMGCVCFRSGDDGLCVFNISDDDGLCVFYISGDGGLCVFYISGDDGLCVCYISDDNGLLCILDLWWWWVVCVLGLWWWNISGDDVFQIQSQQYNWKLHLHTLRHAILGQLRNPPPGQLVFM